MSDFSWNANVSARLSFVIASGLGILCALRARVCLCSCNAFRFLLFSFLVLKTLESYLNWKFITHLPPGLASAQVMTHTHTHAHSVFSFFLRISVLKTTNIICLIKKLGARSECFTLQKPSSLDFSLCKNHTRQRFRRHTNKRTKCYVSLCIYGHSISFYIIKIKEKNCKWKREKR